MMNTNGRPHLTIDIVENGVVVNCVPYEQGVVGKQYVFNAPDKFNTFMADWFNLAVDGNNPVIGVPSKSGSELYAQEKT